MDFIIGPPKVGELDAVIVVVDWFFKYATFIPTSISITAEGTTHLFFKHIVKYWRLPRDIVSDRDPRFISNYWGEILQLLGSKLNMSLSYHPDTDQNVHTVATCSMGMTFHTGLRPLVLWAWWAEVEVAETIVDSLEVAVSRLKRDIESLSERRESKTMRSPFTNHDKFPSYIYKFGYFAQTFGMIGTADGLY
ncbi:transposon ty3-i gag-pol polyprotein [Phtheirospermum japonicum]|uniref:Transposon ty3-i gag-pol polyprotein n=1 Tax=Phtheirospermum japonicum TaxID=374723 RepID=A0A830CRU3_9LAMI|nr:transposon ty3-i gag-pol polyprotein [Phtheirospermum japonicum]